MSQDVPLPWPKPPLTGNRTRGNPFARALEVATAKTEAIVAIRKAKPHTTDRADVILHFRPATKHRRDADGMFPTLKVTLDALVSEGVLRDDGWQHVPAATCRIHTPAAPAQMWVELREVTP